MAPKTVTVTITLPRWRLFVVKWHGSLLRMLVRFGMPRARAVERIKSTTLWAVRGAKVS